MVLSDYDKKVLQEDYGFDHELCGEINGTTVEVVENRKETLTAIVDGYEQHFFSVIEMIESI